MNTLDLLLYGQLGASIVMVIGWLIALLIRNTSYVDVLWAYGVGVLGLCYLVIQSDLCHPARLSILEGILAVWSIRLGTHLLRRCWGKPEDPRYAYLRKSLGKKANLGFFFFFQVQAFWIVLFASPFLILVQNPLDLGWWDHLGLVIWITGFVGVSLADKQLRNFKNRHKDSRKEVCDTGLWKFSRHPNYFFEWILWLGYIPLGLFAVGSWWLFFIPPVLYLFLTKVTGIPFVEARKLEASGDAYKNYVASTSSFFPRSPK
ncbi:MAG: DUF1295 domain-containing protein [Opitutae bacterium]|jgi:cyclopropane-fatty-acyl-phospholipid synthase|nr:DUF1295 domain-containing protein [Opitutae bacterium]